MDSNRWIYRGVTSGNFLRLSAARPAVAAACHTRRGSRLNGLQMSSGQFVATLLTKAKAPHSCFYGPLPRSPHA
jgi:hypothetical protein